MSFINEVMPYAENVAKALNNISGGRANIDAKWIVAQWGLETGNDATGVKAGEGNSYNLGGIKNNKWSLQYGYYGDTYMKFSSLDDFSKAYLQFMLMPNYREGILQAKTPEEYYGALSSGGYATDESYITKNLNRLENLFNNYSPETTEIKDDLIQNNSSWWEKNKKYLSFLFNWGFALPGNSLDIGKDQIKNTIDPNSKKIIPDSLITKDGKPQINTDWTGNITKWLKQSGIVLIGILIVIVSLFLLFKDSINPVKIIKNVLPKTKGSEV